MGYIKLFRKLTDWDRYDDLNMLGLWIHLLLEANWEDSEFRKKTIPRGSLLISVPVLAKRFKLTERQVRYMLNCLEDGGEIVKELSGRQLLITICKYDSYQSKIENDCHDDVSEIVTSMSAKLSPPIVKEDKDDKNINIIYPPLVRARKSQDAGETPPQTPPRPESWRYPSSVTKASLGFNPDAIAEKRKELMGAELSAIAAEIGMPKEAQERFLAKWCEHNPGSDKIKADYEPTFNIKDRATQFMAWWKKHDHRDRDKEREERLNVNAKWGR